MLRKLRPMKFRILTHLQPLMAIVLLAGCLGPERGGKPVFDVVIYGGTAGGVAAAVQTARMGKTVVLIEPTQRLGGLTTGGLGQTDIGNKKAIGGIAREFYTRVLRHYESPSSWKYETFEQYRTGGQNRNAPGDASMWTFEPSVALSILNDFVREHQIEVVYGEQLNRKTGLVSSTPGSIDGIRMKSGRVFNGRMFIDATYEGDLMALAGVTYTIGREPNSQYGETLNGVQTNQAKFHQFQAGVDPYVRQGDATSGLLPGIDPTGPGIEGSGDRRVQAYCFRLCLTDQPENRIPIRKPAGYRELDYELLFRNFEAGETGIPWIHALMPNRKTDINNRLGFSTDYIGQNYAYPEASDEDRAKITERHKHYQQGLMWTLANHPRVPEAIREKLAPWGMCRDEFVETGHWQEQLYVREARRMVGETVMTQNHCQARAVAQKPVGMAAYGMDSHNVQRYVDRSGHVRNEGDVEVWLKQPYPIDLGAIVPKASECRNLVVPICVSASHIAYGSIRMEPVFMVLGQSAATAAVMAIEDQTSVQDVNYDRLRERLVADKQILQNTGK